MNRVVENGQALLKEALEIENSARNSYKERPPHVIPSDKSRVNNLIGTSNLK